MVVEMTEDDTFRVLRKPPISGMIDKVNAIQDNEWDAMGDKGVDEFFKEWGWDYAEYTREYLKYMRI